MRRDPTSGPDRPARAATPAARPARGVASAAAPVARALALQRAVGNRAARAVLARWQKHPDPEQKGVMVPDVSAEDHARFNPPQNA